MVILCLPLITSAKDYTAIQMAFLLVDMAAIYFKYLKILFFELIIIHMVQNSKDKKKIIFFLSGYSVLSLRINGVFSFLYFFLKIFHLHANYTYILLYIT